MKKNLILFWATIIWILVTSCDGLTTVKDETVNISVINGISVPVTGETPVTAITETDQYTGTVSWTGSPSEFAAKTVYTATITLTAKSGYTLTGITENFFSITGAASVSNNIDSGLITATFPATEDTFRFSIFASSGSSKIDIWQLAINSRNELYASWNSGTTANRIIGPITEGMDLDDALVYATGGESGVSEEVSMLAFDNNDYLYGASHYADPVYRVEDGGGSLNLWADPSGDYDPTWGAVVPAGFDGTNVDPGDIIMIDRNYTTGDNFYSRVICVSSTTSGTVKTVTNDMGNCDAFAASFGIDGYLYIATRLRGLLRMNPEGELEQITDVSCKYVAANPVTGEVFFGKNGNPMTLFRYTPSSGQIDEFNMTEDGSWFSSALFLNDGKSLLITDASNYCIYKITGF